MTAGLSDPSHASPMEQFRQQMASSFSLEELRTLCFDLDVNFDELPHPGLTSKIRDLIQLMIQKRPFWVAK